MIKSKPVEEILRERKGTKTIVYLTNGRQLLVYNAVCKKLENEGAFGISINIPPLEEDAEIDYFNSNEISKIVVPGSNRTIYRNYRNFVPKILFLLDKHLLITYFFFPALLSFLNYYFYLSAFSPFLFLFILIHSASYLRKDVSFFNYFKRTILIFILVYFSIYLGFGLRTVTFFNTCQKAEKLIQILEKRNISQLELAKPLASSTLFINFIKEDELDVRPYRFEKMDYPEFWFGLHNFPYIFKYPDLIVIYKERFYTVCIPIGISSRNFEPFVYYLKKDSVKKNWELSFSPKLDIPVEKGD